MTYLYPPRCPLCDDIYTKGICPECLTQIIRVGSDYCLKCGKPITDPSLEICPDCKRRNHLFYQGRSVFSYQGAVRDSLSRMKYHNKREYAETFGREMALEMAPWVRFHKVTRIVPIPLHRSRRRERGYNQAELLARSFGEVTGIPVDTHLLIRTKKTRKQKELEGNDRYANLRHAFLAVERIRPGECILVIDDIYTTGSTADAAARALREAGATRVLIATVAIGG